MHWIVILALAVVFIGAAALTGAKPSGTKPVSRTRLLHVARIVLAAVGILLLLLAWWAYEGGGA